MSNRRFFQKLVSFAAALALPLFAFAATPDISGTFTSSFDTAVGVQNYTYTFAVKDSQLTGKAKSANADVVIEDGKVDGNKITFVENMPYQGQTLRITYVGTIVSADEIAFKRDVAGFANEEFVAKRSK
ncbi:MAG TPA: hypothetical protein VHL14_11180 [Steroidobacteraceae bacterium]|nr:hypothetical protein [Steroidobacteraceae bacterium]